MNTNTEITRQILAYRNNQPNSAEFLLLTFQPLLHKYQSAIWSGSDPKIAGLLRTSPEHLASILHSQLESSDLRQELSLALLETAAKYDAIAANLPYVIAHRLEHYVKSVETMPLQDLQEPALEQPERPTELVIPGWENLDILEQRLLKDHYQNEMTLDEMKVRYDLPKRTISRILAQAKAKLTGGTE